MKLSMRDFIKGEWVSVADCHICNKTIPTKEAISTSIDCEYVNAKGTMHVLICKECNRESKLNELGL